MKEPMLWNTLEEAAEWLSDGTKSKWTPRKIISFSINHYRDDNKIKRENRLYTFKDGKRRRKVIFFDKKELFMTHLPPTPTYLSVLFPPGVKVGVYKYQKDIVHEFPPHYKPVSGGLVRIGGVGIRKAPVYLEQLWQLFLYGKSEINFPYVEFIEYKYKRPLPSDIGPCQPVYLGGGWEYGLFEPLKVLTEKETESLGRLARGYHGYLPNDEIAVIGGTYPVTNDMLGIHSESLEKLLNDYLQAEKPYEESAPKRESPVLADNLTKAFICMAIEKYGYNPDDEKSSVPSKLSSVFSKHGFEISDRSIRGWLKKGINLLPNTIKK